MSIIVGILGLLFLLLVFAGGVFFVIFMARKIGLIKSLDVGNNFEGGRESSFKDYLSDIKQLSHSLAFRFVIITVLIGVMTIPLGMVSDIVSERSRLYQGVLNEIAGTWGHRQQVQGPAVFIPYTEKYVTETTKTDKDGYERKVNQTHYKQRTAIVLPDDLDIEVDLKGQTRKRSLYESLVYTAELNISGSFKRPNITDLSTQLHKIHWDKAWLALGISDTQAINDVSGLHWDARLSDSSKIDFEPGTKVAGLLKKGFHAPLDLSLSPKQIGFNKEYQFSLNINVNGSQGFFFSPFGKTTDVVVKSDWPHPSFKGNVLPNQHEVTESGFEAKWSIPHLARNYPQLWTIETQNFNVGAFSAGVNLFESVSLYSQITRAIKYGALFFILTFITFLIFELGIGQRLHIVQYGVIGLALSMFYLTLLSMAEHAGFYTAYLLAAGINIIMISLYALAAIRDFRRTAIITALLAGLYTMLYSLLQLEDYALLAGTSLLLIILGVIMYLTRNIGRVKIERVKDVT